MWIKVWVIKILNLKIYNCTTGTGTGEYISNSSEVFHRLILFCKEPNSLDLHMTWYSLIKIRLFRGNGLELYILFGKVFVVFACFDMFYLAKVRVRYVCTPSSSDSTCVIILGWWLLVSCVCLLWYVYLPKVRVRSVCTPSFLDNAWVIILGWWLLLSLVSCVSLDFTRTTIFIQ